MVASSPGAPAAPQRSARTRALSWALHTTGLCHLPLPTAGALLTRVARLCRQAGCVSPPCGSHRPEAFVGAIGARRQERDAQAELGPWPRAFRKRLHTHHMPLCQGAPRRPRQTSCAPTGVGPETAWPGAVGPWDLRLRTPLQEATGTISSINSTETPMTRHTRCWSREF